jgi:hypothetical protein
VGRRWAGASGPLFKNAGGKMVRSKAMTKDECKF